jgi:uncharacterized protein (DUF433 family)
MEIELIVNGHCYRHLLPRPDSHYKGLFYKDRKIMAETLYRLTVGEDAQTPEEVAADYDIPVEAVQESIHYCINNADFLRELHEKEEERFRAKGLPPTPLATVGEPPKQ